MNHEPEQNCQRSLMDTWYLLIDNEVTGPFSAEDIQTGIQRLEYSGETLVARDGANTWKPLKEIPELNQAVSPNSTPAAVVPSKRVALRSICGLGLLVALAFSVYLWWSNPKRQLTNLCQRWYECLNNGDDNGLFALYSESTRTVFGAPDVRQLAKDMGKFSYQFKDVGPVEVRKVNGIRFARAKVNRAATGALGAVSSAKEFRFVYELGAWRITRNEDIEWKLRREFSDFGMTPTVSNCVAVLHHIDPFGNWPASLEGTMERVFETEDGSRPVLPWHLAITNAVIRLMSDGPHVSFVVQNVSGKPIPRLSLKGQLRSNGQPIGSGYESRDQLAPGETLRFNHPVYVKNETDLVEPLALEVSYSSGRLRDVSLGKNVPFVFKEISKLIRVQITSKSFDVTKNTAFRDMWVPRVDYKVTNTSDESIERLQLKFVWSLLSKKEIISETTEYVLGIGNAPLAPGQTKSGFETCGKGWELAKVPVSVEVFVEQHGKRVKVHEGVVVD